MTTIRIPTGSHTNPWVIHLRWPRLRRGSVEAKAKPERSEWVLVIDPEWAWFCRLPWSDLLQLDRRARYLWPTRTPEYVGIGAGLLLLCGTLASIFHAIFGTWTFAIILSVGMGGVPGVFAGWYAGRKYLLPGPLWVFRRTAGVLTPVTPKPLHDYWFIPEQAKGTEEAEEPEKHFTAITATFLGKAAEQIAMRLMFRYEKRGLNPFELGVLIAAVVGIGALIFLVIMSQGQGGDVVAGVQTVVPPM